MEDVQRLQAQLQKKIILLFGCERRGGYANMYLRIVKEQEADGAGRTRVFDSETLSSSSLLFPRRTQSSRRRAPSNVAGYLLP
jgi:hypothetical protein